MNPLRIGQPAGGGGAGHRDPLVIVVAAGCPAVGVGGRIGGVDILYKRTRCSLDPINIQRGSIIGVWVNAAGISIMPENRKIVLCIAAYNGNIAGRATSNNLGGAIIIPIFFIDW